MPGNVQLIKALQPLVEAAETTLQLDEAKRARTLIRVDAGSGTQDDLNWLLARDYEGMREGVFRSTRCALGQNSDRMGPGP
jgi:hypothetical protein